MDGARKSNQPLIPPSEADIESALGILVEKMAETNGIRLPNLLYLTDGGKFLTAEEADLGRSALAIAHQALVRSSASMAAKLAFKWNAAAPVNQLPPEILSQVLFWTLEPDNQYVHTLHGLALVCRRWFCLVKESPELWTTLRTDQQLEGIHLVLRKSKGRLLRVIVTGSTGYYRWEVAESESFRWGSFEVSGPQNQIPPPFRSFPHAPQLRDASFQITGGGGGAGIDLPERLYKYPLRHVQLLGIRCNWPALFGTGLVTLDVDNPETIPSPEELCDLLMKCPQLVKLRLSGPRKRRDRSTNDSPLNWTEPPIHMPEMTVLDLKHLSPQYLLLLGRIVAPNCATVLLGDDNVELEESLVREMPPLLGTALATSFRSSRLVEIQATRRRGLCILLHRPGKQLAARLDIQTSSPVEVLDVVGGLLRSRRIQTPITLYFEEQVPLTEKMMNNFPTLRQIDVAGGAMCEDLMRCLAHSEAGADGKRIVLCPNLEYVRMTYVWGELIPSSHCTLLPDTVRRRWSRESGDDPQDHPAPPVEFAIFPPGEVSIQFKEAVKEAQKVVPAIRVVENEEWFFMNPMGSDTDM
ncbi:hypothetical protein FRC01_008338 [Tulasnella sp. 417]|nr:hypothetical protein FRC01_008338 [Tulasnella sp. 417]